MNLKEELNQLKLIEKAHKIISDKPQVPETYWATDEVFNKKYKYVNPETSTSEDKLFRELMNIGAPVPPKYKLSTDASISEPYQSFINHWGNSEPKFNLFTPEFSGNIYFDQNNKTYFLAYCDNKKLIGQWRDNQTSWKIFHNTAIVPRNCFNVASLLWENKSERIAILTKNITNLVKTKSISTYLVSSLPEKYIDVILEGSHFTLDADVANKINVG